MNAVCTITTLSHLPHTFAMCASLSALSPEVSLFVLVTDMPDVSSLKLENTMFLSLNNIKDAYLAKSLIKKYSHDKDRLRWVLKPVFIHYLLSSQSCRKVLYVDNDIHFFKGISFLFDELEEKNVLLCPHWRVNKPSVNKNWFLVNFTDGFYNAGMVGANTSGLKAMAWWAEACQFKCAKIYRKGIFDDQKYLDFIPVIFEKTGIISHRGCNVAFWNMIENERTQCGEEVKINNVWDIVCIHFTKELIKAVLQDKDPLLKPFLDKYRLTLNYFKNILDK